MFSFKSSMRVIKENWPKPLPNSQILVEFMPNINIHVIYCKSQSIPQEFLQKINQSEVVIIGFVSMYCVDKDIDYITIACSDSVAIFRIGRHIISDGLKRLLLDLNNPTLYGINIDAFRNSLKVHNNLILNIEDINHDQFRSSNYEQFVCLNFDPKILDFIAQVTKFNPFMTIQQCINFVFPAVSASIFMRGFENYFIRKDFPYLSPIIDYPKVEIPASPTQPMKNAANFKEYITERNNSNKFLDQFDYSDEEENFFPYQHQTEKCKSIESKTNSKKLHFSVCSIFEKTIFQYADIGTQIT